MTLQDVWTLGKSTTEKWNAHNAPRLSAALAYYTLLSLAPVVVLLILIGGLVFARSSAEAHLVDQVRRLVGEPWVSILKTLIENIQPSKSGVIASVIALGVVLFGSSSVFLELQDALNIIWDAPPVETEIKEFLKRRIASFAMVIAFGVVMLISSLADAVLQATGNMFSTLLPLRAALLGQIANGAISFIAVTLLFALLFKFVPDVRIDWRDVGVGAFITAILFTIGHTILTLYLTKEAVGSAYGAAGSLVAFVVWIYYCAQIFFFGAILTRVYSLNFGTHACGTPNPRSFRAMGGA